MPVPPPKKLATTHHARPIEEETAGKLYLVRDKDTGDGKPVVWARDLPFPAAQRVKETVAGRRLSRTVQLEEQTDANTHYLVLPVDSRSPWQPAAGLDGQVFVGESLPDAGIFAVQAAARAAAAPIAAAANTRTAPPAPPIKPPPMPELPPELDGEGDVEIDPEELEKLLASSDLPGAEDLAQATADLPDNLPPAVNVVELAGKFTCPTCGAAAGAACTDPSGPITHPERIALASA